MMRMGPPAAVRDDMETLLSLGATGRLGDDELLARFVAGRGDASSESAFAAIVDRHGPMVLGLCRRVTGDPHAADDAFQATFLVLARRAAAVRVDGSLSRWLHGVGLRVARRARPSRPAAARLDGFDPVDPRREADPCERADLARVVDEEVARLPDRYRSAVVLCLLEGLTQEQAARRLRCPVDTVRTRLRRARERLRSGLERRGLAPAGSALGSIPTLAPAIPPRPLALAASSSAIHCARLGTLAGATPAALALASTTIRSQMMMKSLGAAAALLALSGVGAAIARSGPADDKPPTSPPTPRAPAPDDGPTPPAAESLARKLAKIQADYVSKDVAYLEALDAAKTREARKAAAVLHPDLRVTIRAIEDLSATNPKDPAVRDACLWVLAQTGGYSNHGIFAGEIAQAGAILLREHGDDPDAVRVGLNLSNAPSADRDALLLGFIATAEGREARGLARLALAQYLDRKRAMAEVSRKAAGRGKITYIGMPDEDGKPHDKTVDQDDNAFAYTLHLKQCDPAYLGAESERLYAEVLADYADVPYRTVNDREMEMLLRQPKPTWRGEPIAEADLKKLRDRLANPPTLGQVAEAQLDDKHHVAVGMAAPEIESVDLSGTPRKLSDYRGKVVALVFWGSWCGPCMREVPREKALAEKMAGRPFAMLGVDTDDDPEVARKAIADSGITWPNWHDGAASSGPITRRYHTPSYPTVVVIDADGKIRSKKTIGEQLDKLVETLVAEVEAKAKSAGTP